METLAEEPVDSHTLSALSADNVLSSANGGFVFSLDNGSCLTTSDDGATQYVTLPFHLLQDSSVLGDGNTVSLYLDASQIAMLTGGTNNVELNNEGLSEEGDGQLILDMGEANQDEVSVEDNNANIRGLDISTLEFSNLGEGTDNVFGMQDSDGNAILDKSAGFTFHFSEQTLDPIPEEPDKDEEAITHVQVMAPRRGPGRPRRDEADAVDPPVGKGPYKCEICNKEFPLWPQLKRHSKFHSDDKPFRCSQCSLSYNVESNLALHMATHNTADPRCPECNKSFSRVASLKAHVMLHEKEESLFCSECGDEFRTVQQLELHKREHEEEWVKNVETHQCRQCQRQFSRASTYRAHMKEHYRVKASLNHKYHKRNIDRSTFLHKCDACMKTFQKPSQLVRHKRIHTGERPYECSLCGKTFNQKGSLHIHMCKHNGYRPFPCDFCPASFSQKGNLRAHIARVHAIPFSGEEVFKCSECTCVFKKLGSLNSHISRCHSGDDQKRIVPTNPYDEMTVNVNAALAELTALGEKSQSRHDAEDILRQTQSQQDAEDILQQALVNSGLGGKTDTVSRHKAYVRRDKRVVNDTGAPSRNLPGTSTGVIVLSDLGLDGVLRRYTIRTRSVGKIRWLECSYCRKEFKKPSDVVRHIRVHTHERPYKCQNCFRTFAVKSTLTAHMKTHTGRKDHICLICYKKFATASSLKVHFRIHTGTKPFQCTVCDRTFRTSGHRRSHIMMTHNGNKAGQLLTDNQKKEFPEVSLEEPIIITEEGMLQVRKKAKNFLPGDAISLERPYKCLVCSLGFRKSSHLLQHTRMHTGERPYKCDKCPKSFLTNGILKIHVRSHDGLKPYRCALCQHMFSTNGSLKRHMTTHSTTRPFMCPYCHKTFKSSVNTRKHMKTHVTEIVLQQAEAERIKDLEANVSHILPEKQFAGPDFTHAFSDQPFMTADNEDVDVETYAVQSLVQSKTAFPDNSHRRSVPSVITHTLHADASGMLTLPDGPSSLTQQNIRDIERTLSEQVFGNTGDENVAGDNERDSDMESTTTEDLARTLASEPQEMQTTAAAQIINAKAEQTSNLYESFNFDFSTIAMQVGEDAGMSLEDENVLAANMANMLAAQDQQATQDETAGVHQPVDQTRDQTGDQPGDQTGPEGLTEFSRSRPYVCPKCTRGFKKSSHLKSHMYSHITEKLFECTLCHKRVGTSTALRAHKKTHRAREFACQVCEFKFTTNGSLIRHMEIHSPVKPFKCSICTSLFRTPMDLRRHIKLHEPREKEGRVIAKEATLPTVRGRRRASIIRLTAEQTELLAKQSTKEAASVSEEVLIASAAEANRVSEIKDPSQQYSMEPLHPNQCKYCPKSFRKPSDLVRHIRIHTGERPYQCNSCNKCFTVKSTLDSHMKTHTGNKSFTCHVCGCVFSTKGSLKVHMRLHTGARPFKCPLCELKFRTSGHRKAHLLVHIRTTNKKEIKSKLMVHRANMKRKVELADATNMPTIDTEDLVSYQTADVFNTPTLLPQEESTGGNFQFQLADNNIQIAGVDTNGAVLATGQLQLFQQLHSSNIIIQASSPDENGDNVYSNGESFGVRYSIHTDEHGQIVNIQTVPDDGSGGGIMFNLGEGLNIEVDEEQAESKPSRYRVTNSRKARVPVNNVVRRKQSPEADEEFLVFHDCDQCGKRFTKPSQLERHLRIHTGERPYECPVCEKAFNQKNSLATHIKSHTGEKPHQCPMCSYSSTQRGNLKTHVRRSHHVVVSPNQPSVKVEKQSPRSKASASVLNMDADVIVKAFDLDMVADLFPQIRHPDDT